MKTRNYLMEYEQFCHLHLSKFIEEIKNTNGIPLNDLKIKDLTYFNNEIINPGIGVYVFKLKNEIFLVGKVRSNTFTERIPKHFDVRPNAWFNRLLFVTCREHLKIPLDKNGYLEASKFCFENLNLVLINVKDSSKVDILEKALRANSEALNRCKNKKHNENILLQELN